MDFTNLEKISEESEEDILRYAQDRIERFHEHPDGSPVELERIGETENKIDYSTDDSLEEPKTVPFRYGCTCGIVFESKDNDMHMVEETKSEYDGQDAVEGYEQPKDYI